MPVLLGTVCCSSILYIRPLLHGACDKAMLQVCVSYTKMLTRIPVSGRLKLANCQASDMVFARGAGCADLADGGGSGSGGSTEPALTADVVSTEAGLLSLDMADLAACNQPHT